MKIGSRDIRHLAIIGAAGAAGVVATLVVFQATERPHVQYEVITVDRAPVVHLRSRVHVVQPDRPLAEVTRTRLRRVELRSPLFLEPVVYVDGVRVESLDALSREDIFSIDVLKGDEAKEGFGTEGAEKGVILVTLENEKETAGEGTEKER